MPTYDYRCPNGHQFEVFQRISAGPSADCPDCGEASERLISGGAGFIFKGEGFYITDYRSEDYKKKASSERAGGANSSESETTTSSSGNGNKETTEKTSESAASQKTESKTPDSKSDS